jgi:ATP-dependent RNA helicase DDX35
VYNANERLSIEQQRARLPIARVRRELLYLVEMHDSVVVVGETGCGKSTQLPQYLAEAGWAAGDRIIACTQPRRIAATSLAERVAQEAGCVLGTDVGYSVRFDHCFSDELTKVKFLTDGMLLREVMLDPLLARYSVIMVDEAHERHLDTDILLGLLKKIQKQRRGLRLIISSATIDAEEMRDFFNVRVR